MGEIIAGRNDELPKPNAGGIAALSLVAANAGMLFIYVVFDLTLFQVILVYWWEALWIGLFSGLKLLTASLFGSPYENRWVEISRGSALFLSIFAMIKSGGAFFATLILTGVALVVAQESLTGTPGAEFASNQIKLILKCSVLFLIGHGLSFIVNFLVLGEYRRARIGTLLWLPFRRSLALFVAVVIVLTLMQTYPGVLSYSGFAVVLIAGKLGWDYLLHLRERESLRRDDGDEATAT